MFVYHAKRCVPFVAMVLSLVALSSCDAHGAVGNVVGQGTSHGARPDIGPLIYLASRTNSQINMYRVGETGDTAPVAVLAGPHTGLSHPQDVALDSAGDIFVFDVVNATFPTIYEFAPGSVGDVAPNRTISGSLTGLQPKPFDFAVDGAGNVYYAESNSANEIEVFDTSASGNVAPTSVISGPDTRLHKPTGLGIDSAQKLWVANRANVTVYKHGSIGNAKPAKKIAGSNTDLDLGPFISAIAFDITGQTFVLNGKHARVDTFPIDAHGNVAPIAMLGGPATMIDNPQDIAEDAAGQLYVSNYPGLSDAIYIFPAGANGNVSPSAFIKGASTQIQGAGGIFIR
jgi:6-phosphogluconolactonase (cycloisomerase 2 family)